MRHILRSVNKRARFCELWIEMFRHLSAVFFYFAKAKGRWWDHVQKLFQWVVNFCQARRGPTLLRPATPKTTTTAWTTSLSVSGDPACSLSTLLRPATPKMTTTAWTTSLYVSGDPACSSSTLLRPATPKMTTTAWTTSLSISGDLACSSSTLLRPATPKTTTSAWTT